MKTDIKQARFSINEGELIEDIHGGIVGVSWIFEDYSYVIYCTHLPTFNLALRTATCFFKKFGKVGNKWAFLECYERTVDDSKRMYGNPAKANFGKYEDDSTIVDADLVTEAQFFIDNLVFNIYQIPISLKDFITATIYRIEKLND